MIDIERFLNTGSIMIMLYAIAVLLIYIAFLKKPSKPHKGSK